MFKRTKSSTFILPMLGGNRKLFLWNKLFVNAHLDGKNITLVYRNSNDILFEKFVDALKTFKNLIETEKINEDLLVQKISYLVKIFNSNNFRFNIGHSQKLINILLKYYWCLGWLKNEPPHCPLDRIVLSKAQIKSEGKTPSWTKMDSIEDYKKYIKEIKKIADPKSIAIWELEIFNRRD